MNTKTPPAPPKKQSTLKLAINSLFKSKKKDQKDESANKIPTQKSSKNQLPGKEKDNQSIQTAFVVSNKAKIQTQRPSLLVDTQASSISTLEKK